MGDVIMLPPRPTEWDEMFSVSVANNGQIYISSADPSVTFPEPLVWALSDLCKRMIEYKGRKIDG